MAVFGDDAVQQTVKATVNINGNRFLLDGRETLEEGWIRFYKPYAHSNDVPLPRMAGGTRSQR